jgi:hypothetical protein
MPQDTDGRYGFYSGMLSFGPNQVNGDIEESYIMEYRVYMASDDGTKVGDPLSTLSASFSSVDDPIPCCDPTAYTVQLSGVEVTGSSIVVVPVDTDGVEMPHGVMEPVEDLEFGNTTTSSTTAITITTVTTTATTTTATTTTATTVTSITTTTKSTTSGTTITTVTATTTTDATTTQGTVVTGSLTVEGVDIVALLADPDLEASFKDGCATVIATSGGLSKSLVDVFLSQGSVKVTYSILVLAGIDPTSLVSNLETAAATSLASDIVTALQAIPNINSVVTGVLAVTNIESPVVVYPPTNTDTETSTTTFFNATEISFESPPRAAGAGVIIVIVVVVVLVVANTGAVLYRFRRFFRPAAAPAQDVEAQPAGSIGEIPDRSPSADDGDTADMEANRDAELESI